MAITPNLLSMILQCDCPNSKLFLLLAFSDTLRRLCNNLGTYKRSDNLHFQIFPFGTFILKITSPRPIAWTECPSPTVISCDVSKPMIWSKSSSFLHMRQVAPESTTELLLLLADKACSVTKPTISSPSSSVSSSAEYVFCFLNGFLLE